jgi:hypothetical protein
MFGRRVVTSSFELFSMYHWVRNLEKNKERRAGCFNFNPIVLRNLNSFSIHLKNYPLQILQQPSVQLLIKTNTSVKLRYNYQFHKVC